MASAPASKSDGGQEKVIAAAQHIVKSLATSKNAADDMIRILSGFDNRLSVMSDFFPPPPSPIPEDSSDPETPQITVPPVSTPIPTSESTPPPPIYEPQQQPPQQQEEEEIYYREVVVVNEEVVVQEAEPLEASEKENEAAASSEAELRIEMATKVINSWELSPASSNIWESPDDDDSFEYTAAVADLIAFSGSYPELTAAPIQVAMARLEDEFRCLLIKGMSPLAHQDLQASLLRRISLSVPSFHTAVADFDPTAAAAAAPDDDGSHISANDSHRNSISADQISLYLINPDVVASLKDIADLMIGAGYAMELCQVYGDVRREALMESLAMLGVDKMSLEEVQRIEWGVLDGKMKKWIQALKVVVRGLLAEERRICGQIFAVDVEVENECFTEAAKGCVLQLLNFGDAIAIGKRSPEKLFRILGMYEALAELLPDLEVLFTGHAKDFIKEEAEGILVRLGDAVRGTVAEFANAIQGETSRKALPGGEIHPLTRYVMNYVRLLADYSSSLNQLLDDDVTERDNSGDNANMTPLGYWVLSLMTYLQEKIKEKSKLYEDEGLQNIFLMNNLLYIVQKVKDSELKTILGDNWIRKRRGQIRQYSTGYLRSSWPKVLSCLRDDGSAAGGSSNAAKAALKERFKNFNLAFEELFRVQTAWKVPDAQLREELKISVSEMVLPAYRSFLGRFGTQLEGGRNPGKYLKYSLEDLENHVSDLFEGKRINV